VQKNHLKAGAHAVGLLLLALLLNGCVTAKPAARIIGSWDGQLHGFPIVLEYTQTTVGISGKEPVPYSIDGDVITLTTESGQTYRVEFPARGEMIQIDEITATEQKYTRSKPESDQY